MFLGCEIHLSQNYENSAQKFNFIFLSTDVDVLLEINALRKLYPVCKKTDILLSPITSPNIDRFSKFIH